MSIDEERYRRNRIREIEEGEFEAAIRFDAWSKDMECGVCDDDDDGDVIEVSSCPSFSLAWDGAVRVTFSRGTDTKAVARVLRKVADVIDGPEGDKLASLGLELDDMDFGRVLASGKLHLVNYGAALFRAKAERSLKEKGDC